MLNSIVTIAGLSPVVRAGTDAQRITGGPLLSAALNLSFRSVKGM